MESRPILDIVNTLAEITFNINEKGEVNDSRITPLCYQWLKKIDEITTAIIQVNQKHKESKQSLQPAGNDLFATLFAILFNYTPSLSTLYKLKKNIDIMIETDRLGAYAYTLTLLNQVIQFKINENIDEKHYSKETLEKIQEYHTYLDQLVQTYHLIIPGSTEDEDRQDHTLSAIYPVTVKIIAIQAAIKRQKITCTQDESSHLMIIKEDLATRRDWFRWQQEKTQDSKQALSEKEKAKQKMYAQYKQEFQIREKNIMQHKQNDLYQFTANTNKDLTAVLLKTLYAHYPEFKQYSKGTLSSQRECVLKHIGTHYPEITQKMLADAKSSPLTTTPILQKMGFIDLSTALKNLFTPNPKSKFKWFFSADRNWLKKKAFFLLTISIGIQNATNISELSLQFKLHLKEALLKNSFVKAIFTERANRAIQLAKECLKLGDLYSADTLFAILKSEEIATNSLLVNKGLFQEKLKDLEQQLIEFKPSAVKLKSPPLTSIVVSIPKSEPVELKPYPPKAHH